MKAIALMVPGGIGKSIMATAVVRNLAKAHPNAKLLVVSGYPEIFAQNPRVHRVWNFANPLHFYDDWCADGRTQVLNVEPYLHPDFVGRRRHLVQIWCEQAGVACDRVEGELHLTPNELAAAKAFAGTEKPVLLMQAFGGLVPKEATLPAFLEAERMQQRRGLPADIAGHVVAALKEKHKVLFVKHPNQPGIEGTTAVSANPRQLLALIPYASKMLLIDSFLQHAAAAINKPAVVCWAGTSPVALGYELHTNLVLEACPTPCCQRPNSFLFDTTWDCPHGQGCQRHSADDIIAALGK